ncbi:MAG: glycosyltransferase family 4 protein [Gemmatimonadota bacterium]
MKILHTLAPATTGGLEEVVIRLAGGQRARGHEVAAALVLAPGDAAHPLIVPLQEAGVQVIPLVVSSRAYLREIRGVREALDALRADVLHTHGYRPDVLHAGAARPLGIPHVTTLHGFTGGNWKNRIYEVLQVRAVRKADAVVAVSRAIEERLRERRVAEDRVHFIPNAWSTRHALVSREEARRILGVPPEAFLIGWVGRLSREKGPDVLLGALERIADAQLSASFIGDGPLREVGEGIASRKADATIRFHGAIPSAGRLFTAFDLFVLSSRTEGTPIALFEAMEASVPIVATAVGGVPDVVRKEALLVSSDDPEGLAAAIQTVRNEPEAAKVRAARARRRLDLDFAPGPWLDRYEALYSSLLRTHPAPR